MVRRIPAEVFPPGDFIQEELDARGWTQNDLAVILGRPIQAVNEMIVGKKAVTPDTAQALGDAFGTGPEFWLNLENAYRLALSEPADKDVAKRARIFEMAPVKEMLRRSWIKRFDTADELEQQIVAFMGECFSVAARSSTSGDENESSAHRAWFCRARQLAKAVDAKTYNAKRLQEALLNLRQLATNEHEARHVPRALSELGVRFVVVEHLPKTRIDGAAFWLDAKRPVVAVSLRYGRIDDFWFTLGHELAHILNGDVTPPPDSDLVGKDRKRTSDKPEAEQRADEFASNFLIPQAEIEGFIARVRPLYSKTRIVQFAGRLGVHPGIVVGQLQHRSEIGWSHSREMLVKVREIVVESALTDGWGHLPQI